MGPTIWVILPKNSWHRETKETKDSMVIHFKLLQTSENRNKKKLVREEKKMKNFSE